MSKRHKEAYISLNAALEKFPHGWEFWLIFPICKEIEYFTPDRYLSGLFSDLPKSATWIVNIDKEKLNLNRVRKSEGDASHDLYNGRTQREENFLLA